MSSTTRAIPAAVTAQDQWLTSLGLALILVGQPIAWWVRGNFTQSESPVFPASVVILGFVLIVRDRLSRGVRLHVPPALLGAYILLQIIPTSAMGWISPTVLMADWAYGFMMVAMLVALAITPIAALAKVPFMVTIVGGISSMLPLYELATSSLVESFIRLTMKGNNNPLILGTVGGITMVTSIMTLVDSRSRSALIGLICAIAFAAGAACVLLSNTRSVMVALVYTIPIFLIFVRPRMVREPHAHPRAARAGFPAHYLVFLGIVAACAVISPTVALIVFGPELLGQVTGHFLARFTGAFAALLGDGAAVVDDSSKGRIEVLEETIEGFNPAGNGVSSQLIAQAGDPYVHPYPHFSYLQAIYDLGILGGILFALLNFVIPAALILTRLRMGRLDPASAFVIVYYVFSHIDHLTHGTPYSWLTIFPVALVYAVLPRGLPFHSLFRHHDPGPALEERRA